MTVLKEKFGGNKWFKDIASYWEARFPSVEARLLDTFRYVDLNTKNRKTFSYELASILRDAGSVFGSIFEAFLKGTEGEGRYNFNDYRRFLQNEVQEIHKWTVHVRPRFPHGLIVPFKALSTQEGTPKWWEAYNNVKHNEYDNLEDGNLENCVETLSAVALIGFLGFSFNDDNLFYRIGVEPYKDTEITKIEIPLFP